VCAGTLFDLRPLAAPVQLQAVRPHIAINVRAHATTQPTTVNNPGLKPEACEAEMQIEPG
jgi:hypothetical protein